MFLDIIWSRWCGRASPFGERRSRLRRWRFLPAVSFLLALCAPSFSADQRAVNPTARLKITKTTTLWKSDDGKVSARRARFSVDGQILVWMTSDGQAMVAYLRDANKVAGFKAGDGAAVTDFALSPAGTLAACIRTEKDGRVTRGVALPNRGAETLQPVAGTDGAENVAWRADGKALAFSTRDALFLYDREKGSSVKLLDAVEGWRPKGAPAYEDLMFAGDAVVARAAGTMRWFLKMANHEVRPLGERRGIIPWRSDKSELLFAVCWLPGPARIPRGAGVQRLWQATSRPTIPVVPWDHNSREPYWLVDIWDAEYPTTLRLSPDGKTLTFVGVKIGELSKNPWRELCLWQVPADGSKPPVPLAELGPIFKRIDVGREYAIGWRIIVDPACVLVDFTRGKAWRLPKEFEVQRSNTDVVMDKLLVGAARGSDVVLIQLEEEKDK